MLNVAVIMGRLTDTPELRQTQNGIHVTSFTVAVNRNFVKQGEERGTDFIDVVAWRSTAEFITKYFRKGSMIVVRGSIQVRSYTDSQEIKRKAFEIVADEVFFGESKNTSGAPMADTTFAPPTDLPAPTPSFEGATAQDFEIIGDDSDLPF